MSKRDHEYKATHYACGWTGCGRCEVLCPHCGHISFQLHERRMEQ